MKGPIVGALLGNQNGREISIEHAYELKFADDVPIIDDGRMDTGDEEEKVKIDEGWFVQKLKQCKSFLYNIYLQAI